MLQLKNMNHQEKIALAVQKIFPDATISLVEKFSKGLSRSVYKVKMRNTDKDLVVKFFTKKIEARVEKSTLISNYAGENNIPSPHTYDLYWTPFLHTPTGPEPL